jgi:autophagy-related protein 33
LINSLSNVPLKSEAELVKTKEKVITSRFGNAVVGGVSCVLFGLAYIYSPSTERHPYLLYAGLIGPLSLASLYQFNFSKPADVEKPEQPAPQNDKPQQKPEVTQAEPDDISGSYIHVSEDESSAISTPTTTVPNSPQLVVDDRIDDEVNQALIKKECVMDLENIAYSFKVGSIVSGFGFLLSVVGIVGDYYML